MFEPFVGVTWIAMAWPSVSYFVDEMLIFTGKVFGGRVPVACCASVGLPLYA
jgi:hypothetical protein